MPLNFWLLRAGALRHPLFLATAAAVTLHPQLAADTFGSGANQFDMDFEPIGNPGNPADTTGAPNPAGSVPYGYRMGTYEVSQGMIEKANALVASGGGNLGITMSDKSSLGGNGVNRPATGVSWYECRARVPSGSRGGHWGQSVGRVVGVVGRRTSGCPST